MENATHLPEGAGDRDAMTAGQPINLTAGEPAQQQRVAAPLTWLLIGLNVLLFAAMVLRGVPFVNPASAQLLRWGANSGPLTLGGEWWRLGSSIFVHIGILHLVLNMWTLFNLGTLAEHVYGRATFLFLYLLSGLAGSVASLGWHPTVVSAGASGAIFGAAGALIVTFRWGSLPVPRAEVRPILSSLVVFAGYNLFYGAVKTGIDNAAHLGGLAAGLAVGAALIHPEYHDERHVRARRYRFLALALLVLAAAMMVARARGWVVAAERAGEALRKPQPDAALAVLRPAAERYPRSAPLQFLEARAYLQKNQPQAAQARLLRAVEIDPALAEAWNELGGVSLVQQRIPEAVNAYTRLVALAPRSVEAHAALALAQLKAQNPRAAAAEFKKAIELAPNTAGLHYFLGITDVDLKQFDEAIGELKTAARLAPNDPQPQMALALAYQQRGMAKEAEAARQRALELQAARQQKQSESSGRSR